MNIPPQDIPKGIDYQLVTVSVMGDKTLGQIAKFEENGWRRVPVERHPSIRSTDAKWLEQGGLALVERPEFLTDRAKVFEQNKADAQLLSVVEFTATTEIPPSVNGRCINLQATAKRERTIKEFFVLHFWQMRVWFRNKIANWRLQ
jgi:hypothetical protein